jgi:hypothetical protein
MTLRGEEPLETASLCPQLPEGIVTYTVKAKGCRRQHDRRELPLQRRPPDWSTLPGTATITLSAKGKTLLVLKRALSVGSQVVTVVLPKGARHVGSSTLTVRGTAMSEHATSAIKIMRVARSGK